MNGKRKPKEPLAVSAEAKSSDLGQRSLARFSWQDRQTAEEIVVVLQGSEAFFAELEGLGFRRLLSQADSHRPTPVGGLGAVESRIGATPGRRPAYFTPT